MKIAVIGCGNMGMAFAGSFLKHDLVKSEDLLLIEKNTELRDALTEKKVGLVVEGINGNIAAYDLVILAVKPQDYLSTATILKQYLRPEQVVLSIMAGIPIASIQQSLDHALVVRAMPNTPAMLGMGITGFTASKEVGTVSLGKIENLINATGRSVYVENENMIDAVTALSGSGPAYFYYLVKQMVEAGKMMGFEESEAMLFVKQTMLGSFHLMNNTDKSLDELIKAVASKGGTTEAALLYFEENKLADALIGGILSAEKRAKELSK